MIAVKSRFRSSLKFSRVWPPLDYYCFIIVTIIIIKAIFVITIFIIALQNYFNMNVNFLSESSEYCKIINYFRKRALS